MVRKSWLVRLIGLLGLTIILGLLPWPLYAGGAVTWQQTRGPSGGQVNALAIAPSNPSTLYTGTNNGIYISRDGGETWAASNEGLPLEREVQAVAVDPLDSNVVYLGTFQGVYRSRDNGATWQGVGADLLHGLVSSLVVDPLNQSVVYAAVGQDVFKSTDGGDTWQKSDAGLPQITVWALVIDPNTPSTLYAGTDAGGVYKTTDAGVTWQAVNSGLPANIHVQALAIHRQIPDILYAGTDQGVYRTTNGAIDWTFVSDGSCRGLVRSLAIDPLNPSALYAGVAGIGICKSTDGGESWFVPEGGLTGKPVLSLVIHPWIPTKIYAGTGNGVYASKDGGIGWQVQNDGLINTNVHYLAIAPGTEGGLYAVTRWEVLKSVNGGLSWTSLDGNLADTFVLSLAIDPKIPSVIFAGTWNGEIYRSLDGGENWSLVYSGLGEGDQITTMVVMRSYNGSTEEVFGLVFAGTNEKGVFVSSDGGVNWSAINQGLTTTQIEMLVAAPEGPGTLFAGTNDGAFRLDLSPGTGSPNLQWERLADRLPAEEVQAFAVHPRTPSTVYVATAIGGVFKTTDRGNSWMAVGRASLPTNVRVQSLAINPERPDVIYAGTDGGVFRSDDGGVNWSAVNEGLVPGVDIKHLVVDPTNPSMIYAGSSGAGVFRGIDTQPVGLSMPPFAWLTLAAVGSSGLVLVILARRRRLWREARRQSLETNWFIWHGEIRRALLQHGQVDDEVLGALPAELREEALQRYVNEHPQDNLILILDPPSLQLGEPITVQSFMRNWEILQRGISSGADIEPVAARITNQLCNLLGFTEISKRSYKDLHGYVVQAPTLRLRIPPRFPIIVLGDAEFGAEKLDDLRDLMGVLGVTSYFALILALGEHWQGGRVRGLKRLMHEAIHDFIVLDGENVTNLFMARDPERRLINMILEQVDLTVVSPYVISGPVPENMFFGREYELKTITRTAKDTNFAIVGGRKIGKTSVLAKVFRLLSETAGYRPFYLDCQSVHNYEGFFEAVGTMWDVTLSQPTPDGFRRLICDLQTENQTIVVLLDEVDALLKHDQLHQEALLHLFRALAQEGLCRFVFCGEKRLHSSLHDPASPLFNFCNILLLSYLEPRDARRIIIEPMEELGLALQRREELVRQIIELSSCHPNLVQYTCQKLITEINERRSRTVTLNDLAAVRDSSPFSEYFLEVMWGNSSAFEKTITLLLLERDGVTFAEIEEILRQRGIVVPRRDLERALGGLILYSVLRKENDFYRFAAPSFPQIIQQSQDVDALLEGLTPGIYRQDQ